MKKHILLSVIAFFSCAMALTISNKEGVSAACSHTPASTVTKAATCTTSGIRVAKCTKCKVIISTTTIPALGHSYSSGTATTTVTCTKCSAILRIKK